MSSYTASDIEQYLVLDRTLTEHIDKIEFHANGSVDITFSDGYKCFCCNIHAAAQFVRRYLGHAAMIKAGQLLDDTMAAAGIDSDTLTRSEQFALADHVHRYLSTLDAEDKNEWWDTERGLADTALTPFLEWAKRNIS
ncbi:MAG: hypothetical protein H8E47_07430 [Anaerolineales bacterium]|nr:hypothetical protein [Anaerolineales bacterium]